MRPSRQHIQPHRLILIPCLLTSVASAQAAGQQAEGTDTTGQPGTTVTNVLVPPPGFPQPGVDINAGLPSSSRPIIGDQRDTFDLGRKDTGPVVLRGAKGATGVIESASPQAVPEIHVVKEGDTMWDLCARYFNNPWEWPRLWSRNPQVQNPHWIYPGDELRVRDSGLRSAFTGADLTHRSAPTASLTTAGRRPERNGIRTPTRMFESWGYIGDPERDVLGQIVGAVEEQLLLAQGNNVYVQIKGGREVRPGERLAVFQEQLRPAATPGARRPAGQLVMLQGMVVVQSFNPKTRIARAYIEQASDVIERGAKVSPHAQVLGEVPHRANTEDLWARVIASPYPVVFVGQHQLAFLDKGSDDGLAPGNTLVVTRTGDAWRRTMRHTSRLNRKRVRMIAPEPVVTEDTPFVGDDSTFPAEVIAVLRVLRTEQQTSLAVVLESTQEIVIGDRALARKGQ